MEIGSQIPLPPIPYATVNEKLIVGKLVTDILAAGYTLSVYDGEELPVELSADADTIFKALSSTDIDALIVNRPDGRYVGKVVLVWGNDCDVISDYSVKIEALLADANAFAEDLINGY